MLKCDVEPVRFQLVEARKIVIKEIVVYAIGAIGSLFLLGYSIHMMVGGVVSERTELAIIIGACIAGAAVIAFMVYDVVKRRSRY